MVKDHSDSETVNPLPPHRLLFLFSKGSFICKDRIAYTKAFGTPVVVHWLKREIAQWIDPTTHRTMGERSYHGATSRSEWRGRRRNAVLKNLKNTFSLL